MRAHIFNEADKLIRVEDREPECGRDFCDRCGDCLHCDEGCYLNQDDEGRMGEHYFVVYEEPKNAE